MDDSIIKQLFEAKMLTDIKEYLSIRNELGAEIDTIGLMMSLTASHDNLKEAFNQNKNRIDEILKDAYSNVYSQVFESELENNSNFSSKFIANIALLHKNMEDPQFDILILNPIAGEIPNQRTILRIEAEEVGFKVGKNYLTNCDTNDAGKANDVSYKIYYEPIKELKPIEVIRFVNELGEPRVINLD